MYKIQKMGSQMKKTTNAFLALNIHIMRLNQEAVNHGKLFFFLSQSAVRMFEPK